MKDKDKYALKETAKDVVGWLIVAVGGFAFGWAISLLQIGIITSLALAVVIPLLIGIAGTFIKHRDDYRP